MVAINGDLFIDLQRLDRSTQGDYRRRSWLAGPADDTTSIVARRRGCASATTSRGRQDYFSRTIVNEPGRAVGCTTHPAFSVTLQPSPCRVPPSSGPVTGTDSVAPPTARNTPPSAVRRPH